MIALPTQPELEAAGAHAGGLLDAAEWELERAIPLARNADSKARLKEDLRALRALRDRWFSAE